MQARGAEGEAVCGRSRARWVKGWLGVVLLSVLSTTGAVVVVFVLLQQLQIVGHCLGASEESAQKRLSELSVGLSGAAMTLPMVW